MARPPAISMHRARGASVPSRRRRIRRPGLARRAAARQPGPRCPRARPAAPIVPGPRRGAAPSPPAALSAPDGRALQVGARASRRPGKHVNLEKVAGRAGPDLRGRAWAPPARSAFVFVGDKGPPRRLSRTRRPGAARRSSERSGGSVRASRGQKRRSGVVRTWPLGPGRAPRPAVSPSRSRPALRRVAGDGTALRSAVYTRQGGKRFGPGLRAMAQGPVRCGHESAAPAASPRAPPPRAGQSTCVSRVTIRFRGDS
ncbi:translation initiation factor IF-2-like [Lutra lutra]|uniref:translation initiation factor IF-2-like n=1 Tax=Lutra lutra TaxID=9657 RepID=UPI001FD5DEE8|nr:translation initiation factor IF-2-like [Lutra lutra]XP_047597768.1 translation initiation factor IF-2-like [Lutra lutra]